MGDWFYNNAQYSPQGNPINYGGSVNMAMYPGPVSDAPAMGVGGLNLVSMPTAPQIAAYGQSPQLYGPPKLIGPDGNIIAPSTGGGGFKNWISDGQNLGAVIQGFGTMAQAYLGWQAMKQAKQQLNFQKEAFNANLNNSISSYNTSLEDKIRGRTSNYEGKEADVQAYLAKHSLKR